jgi:hypothetical protein
MNEIQVEYYTEKGKGQFLTIIQRRRFLKIKGRLRSRFDGVKEGNIPVTMALLAMINIFSVQINDHIMKRLLHLT